MSGINNNMLNYFSKIPKQQLLSQQSNSQSSTTSSSSSQSSSQNKQSSQITTTTTPTTLLSSSNDDLIDIKKSIETLEKPNNNEQINQEYIETCIKLGFKHCISQNDKHKRDLTYKLIELIANNYQSLCTNNCLTTYLTQPFFDKLIKLFETSNEVYVLNLTQLFIKLCGKLLHTNISITNPLLQIMEYSFKHTNNDIRAHGYECWRCLVNNFALDKEFFFKQKKFNLLLMPLVNKSKTYKNENLCKSKAIAWLCLIENINEKLDAHLGNVFIPFLDFCFGYMDTTNTAQTMMNDSAVVAGLDHDEKKENQKRRGSLPATFGSTSSHVKPLPSLLTIGFELFLSFICNGDKSNIPSEYQKHFKYVNLSRNYRVLSTIGDTRNWIKLLNYYFQIILSHVNLLSADLVCFMWYKLLDLFENNELDKGKKLNKLTQNSQQQQQQQFKLNLDDDDDDEDKEELIEYFLLNSIDAVSLNHSLAVLSKPASKNNELNEMKRSLQKVLIEISTHLLKFLYDKNTYLHLLKENKVTNELEKHLKEIGDFLLHSDDANDFNYLHNLKQIIKSIDNCVHYDAIDLWSHVASKLNDRLRINKNKYLNITCIYENFDELCDSFDAVYQTITYPIKQIHKIKIEQNEMKTIVNQCTTICKQFCIMYKYYTQKIEKTNTNSWIEQLMQHIHKQITHTSQIKGLKTITHVKQYFFVTQLINYLLQNLYDFRLDDEYLQQIKKKASSEFQLTMIKVKHDDTLVNLNSIVKINNQLINNYMSIICANMIESEDGSVNKEQDQQMVSNCLLNLIDLNVKLITNCKSTHQLDTIMRLNAESLSKLFEINKLKEKSEFIKQIVQVGLTSKKLVDHYEQLFNELNVCLQHKLLTFDFDSDRLDEFEPIIYSLITFATKPAQKQKFIKTWNSTFGKSTNTILNYSKRLEKCFLDLNDASDSLNLNSGALNGGTLQNGSTGSSRKFAISLPGFNNCANIIANTSNTTANSTQMAMSIAKTNSADKENSPMMISSGVKSPIDDSSSSVPMAQLIKSKQTTQTQSTQQPLNLLLTDDESSSCGDNAVASQSSQNQKASPALANKTSNFIFSPAAGRTSLHITSATATSNTSASSKRKLDLNELIDQMPDKDFVKIDDKPSATSTQSSEINFKSPSAALTEHQKEVKRERSYIPSYIQQVCIDLTSSSAIDNSMSCTFDGIEIIKANELKKENKENAVVEKEVETSSTSKEIENPVTIIPDTMDMDPITATQDNGNMENNSFSEELVERNAKKIRMESANPSPKIYSKIKPNKHIELIEVTDNGEGSKLESTATSVVTVSESDNKIIIENTKPKEPEANKTNLSSQEQNIEKPNEIAETDSTIISDIPDATITTTTSTISTVEVQEKKDEQFDPSQTSTQINEEEKMDMSQDNDEETKMEGDQENDSNIRRSARIKSKGYKSMQVVLNKVDDIIGSGVTLVNRETIAVLTTKENAVVESKTKETEPLNESVVEIKEAEPVAAISSSSQAKKEVTNELIVKRKGRRRTLNGDELKSIKTSITTAPATTHTTVQTNEEPSNSEKLLHKPRSGKIMKIRSKSVTLTANTTSPLSRRAAKTKLQKVIEKLQKTHDKNDEETTQKDHDEDVPLVKLINTDRRRTRSSAGSSTTTTATKSSENEKDLKIDDPFTVDGKAEENQIESVDLEAKDSDTVQPKDISDKDISEQESEKQAAKSLETIPETSNENEAKTDDRIQTKEKEEEIQPTTSSTVPSSSSNIQFSKMAPPTTPTTSILKKRRSYHFTSLEVTSSTINNVSHLNQGDNNTPSKRRVSFCESVQIEEIEPNNNKSIYVRTPKPAVSAATKAKLVLSPYFNNVNKSPTTIQREQQLASTIVSSAASTVTTTTGDNTTSTTSTTTSSSSSTTNSSSTATSTITTLALLNLPNTQPPKPQNNMPPSSPSSSLINFFSINKQSFLSQRTSIIQQQMLQQQQNKTELNSPTASSSIIQPTPAVPPSPASTNSTSTIPTISHAPNPNPSTIATAEPPSQPISTQSSDIVVDSQQACDNDNPIYPGLKDCQESVNKIVGELTSTMWANGIIQLLKSKNIVTIGDLCQLKTSEINNLPFKTPKVDNFMKVIQKYHQQMQSQKPQDESQQSEELLLKKPTQVTTSDESTSTVTTKTKAQNLPAMGSLEEEMAKLEEDNCLDTSIECESIQMNMSQIENTETIKTSTQIDNKQETNNKVSVDDQEDDIEMIEQLKTIEEAAATVKQQQQQQNSYENILKQLNDSIASQNDKNFQIEILNKQFESVKSSDLLNLSNHVNKMIMRLIEVNGAILKQIQKNELNNK